MNAHRPYPAQRAAELHVAHLRRRAALCEADAREARAADATGLAASLDRDAADCRARASMLAAQMAATREAEAA